VEVLPHVISTVGRLVILKTGNDNTRNRSACSEDMDA